MKISRSKRKSSLEVLNKMRSSNIWSPKKGVQRNPAGYNSNKSRTRKRKLAFGMSESTKSSTTSTAAPNVAVTQYRKRKLQKWRRGKGVWSHKLHEKRQEVLRQVKLQEKNRRIVEYKENLEELESLYSRNKSHLYLWQVTVLFTLFATLLQWTISDRLFTLSEIATFVGGIVLSRPNCRMVLNLFNSWRLTRSFKPLYRGRAYHDIMDDCPMVKRKIIKWARRRILKRKKTEEALTSLEFMKKINALFIQYTVRKTNGDTLEWSESTACRYMHRLKLEFGGYSQNYCDGHDREDVLEARAQYIEDWYKLEPRMHLWIRQIDVETDSLSPTSLWRHVDEFKLKGPTALDRQSLGEFGGECKLGTEFDPVPDKRPLLVFVNDECIFRTKRSNPKGWKVSAQNKLRPKDALGTGRMLSGWAHEFGGFYTLTEEELRLCNEIRARRGDHPIKHSMFTLKSFDYGKNREVPHLLATLCYTILAPIPTRKRVRGGGEGREGKGGEGRGRKKFAARADRP